MAASDVVYARRVVVTGAASGIGKATALLLRERGSDVHEQRLKSVPLQNRGCTPRELAEAIVFLLSSAASYVTGQALAVDGGLVMY